MENNPYAAPTAEVDDVRAWDALDLENRKAGRGKRLGAVLLDGLINLIWAAPMVWGVSMVGAVQKGVKPATPMGGLILFGVLLLVTVFVINCVLLHRHGQTLGKRALDIAIVRTDGSRMGLLRYLFIRVLPVGVLGAIPYVGWLVSLADPLLIFGRDKRCLHDLIADTIVVDV
ncbi:MAG: RDD family protein [Burkholderiaceae bacterium]